MSSSTTSWSKKLDKKLAALTDNASKETIQTLANWVAFNRKHAATIASTLTKNLLQVENNSGGGNENDTDDNNPNNNTAAAFKRQWLYWQLIHEILIVDRDTPAKWEKLLELRIALGEALIPAMEQLGGSVANNLLLPSSSLPTELGDCLKEWESLNVFGGPSLMSQIKRLYSNRNNNNDNNNSATSEAAASDPIQQEEDTSPTAPTVDVATTNTTKKSAAAVNQESSISGIVNLEQGETPVKRRLSYSLNNKNVEYDFEASVRNIAVRINQCT